MKFNMRVIYAGLAGAVAMFIWMSIAHMSPLGMVGYSKLTNESAASEGLKTATANKGGLYFMPWMLDEKGEMKEPAEKYGQTALILYHANGPMTMEPYQLVHEFIKEAVEALILAFLMAQTVLVTLATRVVFATAFGLAASLTTNASYWIWYGFPGSYTAAYTAMDWVGYIVAGVAIALLLPKTMKSAKA